MHTTYTAGEELIMQLIASKTDGKLVPMPLNKHIITDRLGRAYADMWWEDIHQEVLLELWVKHQAGLVDDAGRYAVRVSHGKATDRRRCEERRAHGSLDIEDESALPLRERVAASSNLEPDAAAESREELGQIIAAAKELDPEQAPGKAFRLRARHGFDEALVREELKVDRLPAAHRQAWSQAVRHIKSRVQVTEVVG